MRVLIFGGTTEGRELASELAGSGHEVTVSVATDMGADELCGIAGIKAVTGRKDASGMCALLHNKDICIDATHPYATEAGRNIREACERTGVRCLRLLRDDTEGLSSAVSEYGNIICVSNAAEAAAEAAGIPGNILLATGVKELPYFGEIERDRLFARVLPVPESLEKCREEGISARNIIAMHGPFTESLNLALIEQYGISVMVTKDGGANGGFGEKARAAERSGICLIVIKRPEEEGISLKEVINVINSL